MRATELRALTGELARQHMHPTPEPAVVDGVDLDPEPRHRIAVMSPDSTQPHAARPHSGSPAIPPTRYQGKDTPIPRS